MSTHPWLWGYEIYEQKPDGKWGYRFVQDKGVEQCSFCIAAVSYDTYLDECDETDIILRVRIVDADCGAEHTVEIISDKHKAMISAAGDVGVL